MPILIVGRPLLWIIQDFVSFTDFLETFFGHLIARIAVRVELKRELPIGFFDVLFASLTSDPKDFVIIALRHAGV